MQNFIRYFSMLADSDLKEKYAQFFISLSMHAKYKEELIKIYGNMYISLFEVKREMEIQGSPMGIIYLLIFNSDSGNILFRNSNYYENMVLIWDLASELVLKKLSVKSFCVIDKHFENLPYITRNTGGNF